MNKKDDFKEFASKHPELNNYIINNNSSWQKLYEVYDIYGEDENVWKPYLKDNSRQDNSIKTIIKNIDTNSLKEHIETAQKALGFIEEIASKGAKNITENKIINPRPIKKFFGD